ncbi:MAG TPA: hypothetical protein VHM26_07000 [Chitinophagaceae bacterium]|nr:hypothetical protein [Chitinophagaceae bacterium]
MNAESIQLDSAFLFKQPAVRIFLLPISVVLIIYGCSSGDRVKLPDQQGGFIKDIPKDRWGNYYSKYRFTKEMTSLLHLDSIDAGVDSLVIRVWYSYMFNDTAHLFTISFTEGEWKYSFREFTYNQEYDDQTNTVLKTTATLIRGRIMDEPKTRSWNSLLNKLCDLGVMTLPDVSNIRGYTPAFMDSDGVGIEVAASHSYRIYSYPVPCALTDKLWQADKVERIIKLLEKEFGFKRIRACEKEDNETETRIEDEPKFNLKPVLEDSIGRPIKK